MVDRVPVVTVSTRTATRLVVDDVAIAAGSAGLGLECLVCRAQDLVLLDELAFNSHVERFLAEHPAHCTDR